MKNYDWLVVGGGFQGIIAAALLSKTQENIAVLERGEGLGGVFRGKEHNGLTLDFGCHLFNNDESDVTALMLEIFGDNYHPVDVRYASITKGHKKEEIAVSSFDFLPDNEKKLAIEEILKNAKEREKAGYKEYKTIKDWIVEHYGPTLGSDVLPFFKKACGHEASEVAGDCIFKTQLTCAHISDDEDTLLPLKEQHPEFDKVVALSSQKDQMRFYREAEKKFKYRTFYPSQNGMRGFSDCAESYFDKKDVDILTKASIQGLEFNDAGLIVTLQDGEKIQAKKLVWTLDIGFLSSLLFEDNPISPYMLNVPMSLFYYFVDKDKEPSYTYLHDFSGDTKSYRISAPGFYGKQSNQKGQSYICAEVPAKPDTDLWQNPADYADEIWKEVQASGMVDDEQPQESFQLSTPVSYPLMKAGYKEVYDELADKIEKDFPNIVNVNMNAYTKNDIIRVISNILENKDIAA